MVILSVSPSSPRVFDGSCPSRFLCLFLFGRSISHNIVTQGSYPLTSPERAKAWSTPSSSCCSAMQSRGRKHPSFVPPPPPRTSRVALTTITPVARCACGTQTQPSIQARQKKCGRLWRPNATRIYRCESCRRDEPINTLSSPSQHIKHALYCFDRSKSVNCEEIKSLSHVETQPIANSSHCHIADMYSCKYLGLRHAPNLFNELY